jgi:hypothetical protein
MSQTAKIGKNNVITQSNELLIRQLRFFNTLMVILQKLPPHLSPRATFCIFPNSKAIVAGQTCDKPCYFYQKGHGFFCFKEKK